MKNSEKAELKADVRELDKKGYSRKEGIKILIEYGYCRSTATSYWDTFVKRTDSAVVPQDGGNNAN